MNFKPVIFSADEIAAINAGRKTMFRTVVKPQPPTGATFIDLSDDMSIITIDRNGEERDKSVKGLYATFEYDGFPEYPVFKSPYQVGDILWVKETFGAIQFGNGKTVPFEKQYWYKADEAKNNPDEKWGSPLFMPREAARLFLRVTGVKVERLQDISHDDALSEGINTDLVYADKGTGYPTAKMVFAAQWNAKYAKRGHGWDKNDWVYAHTFERIEKPEGWPCADNEAIT